MDERLKWFATLRAYALVQQAAWPALNPRLATRQGTWNTFSASELKKELDDFMAETATSEVRVFWKYLPDYVFGGGNVHLARDAGLTNITQMLGKTDFDPAFPWWQQAAKYRKDDMAIIAEGKPQLDIVERQRSDTGMTWLRTSKTPIVLESGEVIGLMGMYGRIDQETAVRLTK